MKKTTLMLMAILMCSIAKAQYTFDVADIDTGTTHSLPHSMFVYKKKMYFYAIQKGTQALWEVERDKAPVKSTLLNVVPSASSHSTKVTSSHICSAGGKLFLSMWHSGIGAKVLAGTDGTSPAQRVDSTTTPYPTQPDAVISFNNIVYFIANRQLYSYDPATDKLKSISGPGTYSPVPSVQPAIFNGKLYFTAQETGLDAELFQYTPGDAAFVLTADINPGSSQSLPQSLLAHNGKLYFSANTNTYGRELYSYDGVNPPIRLTDLKVGATDGLPTVFGQKTMAAYGDSLYFSGITDATGEEPFLLDINTGTIAPLADIAPGNLDSKPINYIVYNNKLLFITTSVDAPHILWSYDFANLPTQIPLTYPFVAGSVTDITLMSGQLYFSANVTGMGHELVRLTDTTYILPPDTTDTPTHVSIIPLKGKVTAYPNPTHSSTTLEVSLQDAQAFAITLTDVYGRSVYTITKKQYNAGKHNITIPMQALPAGIYYYHISNGKEQLATGKLMKE